MSTDVSITETDQLTDSGYKSTLSNISAGTSFEQKKDLYFGFFLNCCSDIIGVRKDQVG